MEEFLAGRVKLHAGNCRVVLMAMAENSVDACVTDPPYGLQFMGKGWDRGDVAFDPATWRAVWRVLKPGAYLVAMGGTRTYHRLACAIEDAGFDVRDMIAWTYGSGFPKSHDISKGIDRAAGAEREIVGRYAVTREFKGRDYVGEASYATEVDITAPATDAAQLWDGWGTALKPALEPICLARKPLSEKTIAANVLRHGTGGLNIDGCRIGAGIERDTITGGMGRKASPVYGQFSRPESEPLTTTNGRWPANLIHDGSEEVRAAFPETEPSSDQVRVNRATTQFGFGDGKPDGRLSGGYADNGGSAARFFYTAKADADDRLGSKHPTVKPLDLMQYLVRLVTPPRGTVLDPFAGTGTTGEAAWREGMAAVLIEAEAEYQADIRRRMGLVLSGPDERAREAIKAKNLPRDDGPLFASRETWGEMWARPFDFSRLKDPPG